MSDDVVAVLRLTGGKANAMTNELLDTIERLVDEFESGPASTAVLTGYSKYFSAGLPLPSLLGLDRAAMKTFMERFTRTMMRVFTCEKPIVAAINGHAIAGGCVLALMCDMRVMISDETMWIGLNETQLGIGLPAVVMEPLRAQVPSPSLPRIAIGGALMPPSEAHELGLVHAIAPDPQYVAVEVARDLAKGGDRAVRQVKRALRAPVIDAIARTDAVQTEAWLETWFSPEAQHRLHAAAARMNRQ